LDGPAGYDTKLFIDEIDKQFVCSLCSQVLRHAVVINNDPWCVAPLIRITHLAIKTCN
jgi:hypothetical protein